MKAWLVKRRDEFYVAIVFAETRGRARSLARSTDACEDANFLDIEVYRRPSFDKYYEAGKIEMEWDNPQDRLALVKEGSFCCEEADLECCEACSARDYCQAYKDCADMYARYEECAVVHAGEVEE